MTSKELKHQIAELQKKLDLQLEQEEKSKSNAIHLKIKTLQSEIAIDENNLAKKRRELELLQESTMTSTDKFLREYKYQCDHCSSYMKNPDEHRNPSHTWTNGQSFYTCQRDYVC